MFHLLKSFGGSHNIPKLKSSDKYAEKGKNYLLK